MSAYYGTATISGPDGKLQYYARPDSVYNSSNSLVESGAVIGHPHSYQGALLIPHMSSPNRHYLITNDLIIENTSLLYGGHYIHEIEKTWAYPEGEIKTNKKNIQFSNSTGTRLTAVHHTNGRDIWIVIRVPETDTIAAYLLTEEGIQFPPIFSKTSIPDTNFCTGQIKASPEGDLLGESLLGNQILGENIGMLHQFDRATGVASNTIVLPAFDSISFVGGYGSEFSQFGNNFFITGGDSGSILQYSLSNYDSATVVSSVYHHPPAVAWNVRSMQIGIDSKIYTVGQGANIIGIENPDAVPTQVIVNNSALSVSPHSSVHGLPDFIQTFFHPAYFDYSRACDGMPIKFWSRNPNADSLRWDFGDPASGANNTDTSTNVEHLFTSADTFGVTLTTYTNGLEKSFFREIIIYEPPSLSEIDSIHYGCIGQPVEIEIPLINRYTGVLWSDSLDTAFRVFTEPTEIGLLVYNFCDTVSTNVRVAFDSVPFVSLDSQINLCAEEVTLMPDSLVGDYILWSTGVSELSIEIDSAGTFWIETGNGCDTVADTIIVNATYSPSLLADTNIDTCISALTPLLITPPPIGVSQWVFDSKGNEVFGFFRFGLDTYQIVQFGGCDTLEQDVVAEIFPEPTGEILVHRDPCDNGGLKLEFAGTSDYQNLVWNTGQTTEIIRPMTNGIYTVEVLEPPCRSRWSVDIDSLYCPDQLGCVPMMPNIFSPNSDGINEYFRPLEDLSYCLGSDAQLSIYNRWGILVFHTVHVMAGWDGTVNGTLANEGVYYYVFSATDKTNAQLNLTGSVFLTR